MIRKALLYAGALAVVAASAHATPVFQANTVNDLYFANFENAYRSENNCAAVGGCMPVDPLNDPPGWQRVMPATPIIQGDVFAGVFNVQNIDADGTTVWSMDNTAPGVDTFSGYFAQQVLFNYAPGADPYDPVNPINHIVLTAPAVDPFGVLGGGEMFQLYVDTGTVFESNGTTFDDIIKATDGTFWLSLGTGIDVAGSLPGTDLDGFAYSHVDVAGMLTDFSGEAELALEIVQNMSGWDFVSNQNDPNEHELGDLLLPPYVPVVFNTFVGRSELELNSRGWAVGGTTSPWAFGSNDPITFYPVPEPGTMILLGSGLLGLAGYSRKRGRKKG